MTPEREAEIQAYVVEYWGSGFRVVGYLGELLAALDDERKRTKDLQSYIVELGEAKARESEKVKVLTDEVAHLERDLDDLGGQLWREREASR